MEVQDTARVSTNVPLEKKGLPPPAKVLKLDDNESAELAAANNDVPNVELLDKSLWDAFCKAKNEMIVTKPGRRMFPTITFALSNLEEASKYAVSLRFVLADDWRYKFVEGQWKTNGVSDVLHDESRMVINHHCSPAVGEILMKKPISFKTLKITHHPESSKGNILLHTMHRYSTELLIKKLSGDSSLHIFPFPETTFTAVTSYQSSEVTRLKVSNNPFAKGFKDRETYLGNSGRQHGSFSLVHPYSAYSSSLLLPSIPDWSRFPSAHYPHFMYTPPVTPPFATTVHQHVLVPPPPIPASQYQNAMMTPLASPTVVIEHQEPDVTIASTAHN